MLSSHYTPLVLFVFLGWYKRNKYRWTSNFLLYAFIVNAPRTCWELIYKILKMELSCKHTIPEPSSLENPKPEAYDL